jgi:hypothetical protein
MAQSRLQTERIDFVTSIRPMSYNVPGHYERMRNHCKRVKMEYFDSGLHKKETGHHYPGTL